MVLRFAADFTPPPHPAGMALAYFAERLPQVIPGSEARIYYAGALYTIPEAFEAMRQGNLEMAWMQMGKAAPVDPWMMTVVGPGVMTTVGAVDSLEKTKTYQMLVERLAKNQAIKVFGAGADELRHGRRRQEALPHARGLHRPQGAQHGPGGERLARVVEGDPGGDGVRRGADARCESGVIDGLMTSIGGWLSRARAGAVLHHRRRRRVHRRLLHGQREPALVGPPDARRRRRRSRG